MGKKSIFGDLINIHAFQEMIENLHVVSGIPMEFTDENGKTLVKSGCHNICDGFNHLYPMTCKQCRIRDRQLRNQLKDGGQVAYKCANSMWDISVPIMASDKHLATLNIGHFFFEGETPDKEAICRQADAFGLDTDTYMEALKSVPVVSADKVSRMVQYNTTFIRVLMEAGIAHADYLKTKEKLLKKERELSEAKMESDKINSAKNTFITTISHELRTPVAVILSTIQLMEMQLEGIKGPDVESMCKHMKTLKQNCRRLLRIVNNIIDISKIDAGFKELNTEPVDIVGITQDTTMLAAEYARKRDIEIQFDTDTEEFTVEVDRDKFVRMLLNLLSNAIKFNHKGGKIFVKLTRNNQFVSISVRDTGIGMSKNDIGGLFERFYQIDSTLSRPREGMGIGLALVKLFAEMHGGNVKVSSRLGKGSEFIIQLPLIKSNRRKSIRLPNSLVHSSSMKEKLNLEFSDIYL